jgi:prophage regulatory protein
MSKTPQISTKPAYLDRESAAAYVSLAVNTMQRLVAKGEFPGPRQLTGKRVGWLVREVDEWAEARPASTNLPVENCQGTAT